MAKDASPARRTNRDRGSVDIHLVLKGGGGFGKPVMATWLAEFLISRGRDHILSMANPSTAHPNSSGVTEDHELPRRD